MEGFFPMPPPPHPFQLHVSFIHFFSVFGLSEPPPLRKFQSLLWVNCGQKVAKTEVGEEAGVPTRITKIFFTNHTSRKKKYIANLEPILLSRP